jgi:hypothetical protein
MVQLKKTGLTELGLKLLIAVDDEFIKVSAPSYRRPIAREGIHPLSMAQVRQ